MKTKITVIGGGTGSFVILSGIKQYNYDITAIVTVGDDGGSTGRLRDEFGFLPVGDLRQCIAALSDDNKDADLKKLLLYRFEKGNGLKGHNFGNLLITALSSIYGSETSALEAINKIFHLKGHVLPVSLHPIKLKAKYSSGKVIISEHKIEEHLLKDNEFIAWLSAEPRSPINPKAKLAILKSQYIILGPGDLYGSTIANLIIDEVPASIKQSQAKIIMIMNLMTLKSQTHNMTAKNHVDVLEKYLSQEVDFILINNQPIPPFILKAYQKLDEYPVIDDLMDDPRVIRAPLLDNQKYQKPKSDKLKRSLLRHNSQKTARLINQIIKA